MILPSLDVQCMSVSGCSKTLFKIVMSSLVEGKPMGSLMRLCK